jgi:2-polyprenyl-6-methoxyphenol hydroxylase-like FAD-dependent oxidoreductase
MQWRTPMHPAVTGQFGLMEATKTTHVDIEQARCCVVGGGPAGIMLGYLLARAGVDVLVLEKHGDFLRDFRGDTIHPSTLDVMHELGLLNDFLTLPHQEVQEITGHVAGVEIPVADFSHLPTRCRFAGLMPQWDFLDFLAGQGRRYPTFRLLMRAEVHKVIEEDGRIVGVQAKTPDGPVEVRASLIVAADGRHSTVRAQSGLAIDDLGAPMDVLWMRLSRRPGDKRQAFGFFSRGKILVMLDRGDYWQCGFVISKGGIDELQRRGLESFRSELLDIAPFLGDRVGELKSWDDIRLLTVVVDRLRRWYRPGLLCIGDAAHAMSPVGGVGINLAIQDAVAAANLLAAPLRDGSASIDLLSKVQKRRELPTRLTQRLQVFIQNRIIRRVITGSGPLRVPWPAKLLRRFPVLRRIPARLIGVGFRPEHVRTRDAFATR